MVRINRNTATYNPRIDYSKFSDLVAEDIDVPVKQEHLREFICWDGEGVHTGSEIRHDKEGNEITVSAQSYALFGCSTGERITGPHLSTRECLDLLLRVRLEHPHAIFVGFVFDYDVNMILRSLSPHQFQILREKGRVRWCEYSIEHVPHKWLTVSKTINKKRVSARVSDIFGFYQTSFIKAVEDNIADDPLMADLEKVREGKGQRKTFTYDELPYITAYWETEIALLKSLVERLRETLYSAGFKIGKWHGPGALAEYVYKRQGIKQHKAVCPEPVREAAAYGFAGGRFELFNAGRHTGPIYSLDINSAYPAAISQLPSLSEGEWVYVERPQTISQFGIYYIDIIRPGFRMFDPSPLFHRDEQARITYPWNTAGWYWSPEARLITELDNPNVVSADILYGWEWQHSGARPFEFVEDFYRQRRALKDAGNGAEKAFKLAMNSLYGKMAQRVGWERNGKPPAWHQLEWAGWVTSWTRAKLYSVMREIPYSQLIAVETDGIYTTMSPDSLGIVHSKELGGWEVKEYRELLYLQSGVYAYEDADGVKRAKYRGLDAGSLSFESMTEFLQNCQPLKKGEKWPNIEGPTTRFVGYPNALIRQSYCGCGHTEKSHGKRKVAGNTACQERQCDCSRFVAESGGMKDWHRRWLTSQKEIQIGVGKRQHQRMFCKPCKAGLSPYETPHPLLIASVAQFQIEQRLSHKHDIPWENGEIPAWRIRQIESEGLLAVL